MIEACVIAVLYNPVYKAIEDKLLDENPEYIQLKGWVRDQYAPIATKITLETLGIGALVGVVVCFIVWFVRKNIKL